MQIDFHHATTYVAARLAGFPRDSADIIAHAAQYVDDCTSSGIINFDNEALYSRISSAHKMLDPRNADDLANHLVWIPFHFLPGNDGLGEGQNPIGTFINKLICKPDSPIARQMVRQTILEQDRPYGLHRLGVAMHVYADTWAHQGLPVSCIRSMRWRMSRRRAIPGGFAPVFHLFCTIFSMMPSRRLAMVGPRSSLTCPFCPGNTKTAVN
jgi:hypothetical protein